jgi:hypothetical protein
MRYLKTYEKICRLPIKNYFVLTHNTRTLFVYKIDFNKTPCDAKGVPNNTMVSIESLYFYQDYKLTQIDENEKFKTNFNIQALLRQILFDSNRLDTVKKELPILYTKLKYNI